VSNFPSLPKYPIRNAARAVIVKDGSVLLVKFDDEHGPHYNWPGGGQDFGESIEQNLHREVWEETNAKVEVERLFCIYEHMVSEALVQKGHPQYFSLIFLCKLQEGCEPRLPVQPDPNQVAVEWIPIEELQSHWILPNIIPTVQAWYRGEEIGVPVIVNRDDA